MAAGIKQKVGLESSKWFTLLSYLEEGCAKGHNNNCYCWHEYSQDLIQQPPAEDEINLHTFVAIS